jgi:hypothetical protein
LTFWENKRVIVTSERAYQRGTFSIKGIAPGEYELFAWEDAPENAFRNASFLADFPNQGQGIRIERNSRDVLDVDVIPRQ